MTLPALDDGREVVLKARPPAERHLGCQAAHHHLWSKGYPCPQPLAGPAPLGALEISAETYLPGGVVLTTGDDRPALFAQALAELVALAPAPAAVPTMEPPPPWSWWDHRLPGLWPPPDDRDDDLNAHPGPAWLDHLAAQVRRLADLLSDEPPVIGHTDWETQNLRWTSRRRLLAVHDWDSLAARPEPVIAGVAAAVFTATGAPHTEATVADTQAFLTAYQHARGAPFIPGQLHACWAAGLWVRAFNAKKDTLAADRGHTSLQRLAAEAPQRLERAHA